MSNAPVNPNQPRIILHTPEPTDGGALYVAQLAAALAGQHVPVVLFCPANFEYEALACEAGAQVVHSAFRAVNPSGWSGRLARNLGFAVRSGLAQRRLVQPGDIVHFHNPLHLPLGLAFLLLAKLQGAAVVLTAHDPLPHRWRLPRLLRWLERGMLTCLYGLCDSVLVHNQTGKSTLVESFHQPPAKVFVVSHGPYGTADSASSDYPPFDRLRLLMFGAIRENKGTDLAIAAVQKVNATSPIPVHLTIAGRVDDPREQAHWEHCKRLIAQQPDCIEIREKYHGDEELGALFGQHHAVLLPYREFSSESGVAALALSSQRPIIATSAGSFAELLAAADCGIAVAAPTVEAVARAITEGLQEGPDRLAQMGRRGRDFMMERRSWHEVAEQTLGVYRKLALFAIRSVHPLQVAAPAVVVLHTPEPVSSAALYVDELSQALTAEGLPVHIICPRNHQALPQFRSNPAIRVHTTLARSTNPGDGAVHKVAVNLGFLASTCAALLRRSRRGSIVHFQYSLHPPLGLMTVLCAWLRGASIAFTAHDPVPHKWMLPKRLRWMERSALGWTYRLSDVILVHSEAGKSALASHFPESARKVRVIVHGPYELPSGLLPQAQSDRLEVLFFGALRENKGADLAIQAVQRLHREGVPIRLTIAGSVLNRKEQGHWERCRTLIADCPEPIPLVEGFIPDEQLPELFARCHCFVLPYRQFFSDSGVAFMALANGRAILATGAGGLQELLENSGGGLLIEEPTVDAVTAALRTAVRLGPEHMHELGQRGSRWVLQECGWPRVGRETAAIYQTLGFASQPSARPSESDATEGLAPGVRCRPAVSAMQEHHEVKIKENYVEAGLASRAAR